MAEALPPLTAADIRTNLANPTFSVYLYVGAADDLAWHIALAMEGYVPRLRVYRARDRQSVAEWLPTDDTIGVVFGWGASAHAHLDQQQTEDMLLVSQTIEQARA